MSKIRFSNYLETKYKKFKKNKIRTKVINSMEYYVMFSLGGRMSGIKTPFRKTRSGSIAVTPNLVILHQDKISEIQSVKSFNFLIRHTFSSTVCQRLTFITQDMEKKMVHFHVGISLTIMKKSHRKSLNKLTYKLIKSVKPL